MFYRFQIYASWMFCLCFVCKDYSEYMEFERKPNDFETKTLVPDFTGVKAQRHIRSHAGLE